MADFTPAATVDGGMAKLTFGSNTYHGIVRYGLSSSVDEQIVKFSSSSGITSLVSAGGPQDMLTIERVAAPDDSESLNALKRGTESSTCEFHPEGDTAGNIEVIFENGIVITSEFGGDVGGTMMQTISIRCDGDLTIQDVPTA